jgi:hypothetical protein
MVGVQIMFWMKTIKICQVEAVKDFGSAFLLTPGLDW